ncbi:MAG TPA: MFS transporter [Nocardioidaceae bacterium]|nr:MFS transporter [Nocardioidaceae bacterium]
MTATKRPLYGWLSAELISLCGTRLSMLAIPWLVLTTTGSATQTGLVAFAEMAPYVLAKALAGPYVDRVGARRICVAADLSSVVVVGAIPVLHMADALDYGVLLGLVAVAGLLRGPSDGAKAALVPDIVDAAGVPTERATGLQSAVERFAGMTGSALAGLIIVAVGAANALLVDAASFAISAVLIAATAPRRVHHEAEDDDGTYVERLRSGWDFLRRDPVLVAIVTMVAITNLIDQAYMGVLLPFWVHDSGHGAGTLALLFATWSAASTVGAIVAAWLGPRLPRFSTYVIAFIIAGAPRFIVLAIDAPLWLIVATGLAGGLASGFINPILGAVIYERIPRHLMGRVTALNTSLCWSLIPFGGIVGGFAIAALGLSPALVVLGMAYFAATMLPTVRPEWRTIDDGRKASRNEGSDDRVGEKPAPAGQH